MKVPSFLTAVRRKLFAIAGSPFPRSVWCREQQRHLRVPGHSVIWVRADALPWAKWGARRGFFEVQQMDGLSYLRSVGAP